jgi:peptidoglycan-N-acetylglucosamine deacetylase
LIGNQNFAAQSGDDLHGGDPGARGVARGGLDVQPAHPGHLKDSVQPVVAEYHGVAPVDVQPAEQDHLSAAVDGAPIGLKGALYFSLKIFGHLRSHMPRYYLLIVTLLLTTCSQISPTGFPPTRPPVFTPTTALTQASSPVPSTIPSHTPTAAPTSTSTVPPGFVSSPPTPIQTPTLVAGPAPTLVPIAMTFIRNGDRTKPLVALTFDLCQKPELPSWFDQGIYDALTDAQVPATFFLGGDWMRTHVAQTRLLAGNPLFELGNHSWSHPDMPDLATEDEMSAEILKTQDIMYQLTGRQPRLFRPPSGKYNDIVLDVVARHGLMTIQWDADTADPVPDNDAQNIVKLVRERTQNGSIILMHANGRGWHTAEALPVMIKYLRGAGYCLVTVPQLIGLDPTPAACGD